MGEKLILLIETATTSCSVALSEGGKVIAVKEANERNIHASHITLFIEEVMKTANKQFSDLNAVAISKGPGSYTGLRIGVSTAKGLCYALDIPMLSVNTLEAMASGLLKAREISRSAYLIPMIDARRMEVYTGIYSPNLELIEDVNAKIIDEFSFDQYPDKELILFGDGAEKFKELFSKKINIQFQHFENSAAHLGSFADEKLRKGEVENTAYFEPFYLKEFVATKKVN
ncbi:tRNA (adenosine(37)-N6)-threonylcarbamoyltransferase complex dimerization subunit type 1 TsaB [Daejeonella lutea]|uniref:tRNA threonylcarbamoyladenosine biosynthesis protein TsaB n=1 Tax=Daejeonella lutea TaxID=572036 RepID=A0A1T5B801_9SPHI|nr:tRNA (adenosine(37)-N6)-threonylcarbamoyltransferase complex dimerization subunit type 1 TsaB [Daejeonella lutea]SKB43414.1 tRNA threonylcarbamoyladenosine biosynthesis protein TsaB [Daejeonella lutea]